MNIVSNTKKSAKKAEKRKKGLRVSQVDSYLRFVMFLAVIGGIYIWNSHQSVKQVRILEELKSERKALKNKYLMKQSTMHAVTRFSEIKDQVDSLGLYRSSTIYKISSQSPAVVDAPKIKEIKIDTIKIDSLRGDSLNLNQHLVSN